MTRKKPIKYPAEGESLSSSFPSHRSRLTASPPLNRSPLRSHRPRTQIWQGRSSTSTSQGASFRRPFRNLPDVVELFELARVSLFSLSFLLLSFPVTHPFSSSHSLVAAKPSLSPPFPSTISKPRCTTTFPIRLTLSWSRSTLPFSTSS